MDIGVAITTSAGLISAAMTAIVALLKYGPKPTLNGGAPELYRRINATEQEVAVLKAEFRGIMGALSRMEKTLEDLRRSK